MLSRCPALANRCARCQEDADLTECQVFVDLDFAVIFAPDEDSGHERMSSPPVTLLRSFNNDKSLDFLADMPKIFAD
jgi:hypothetical protein